VQLVRAFQPFCLLDAPAGLDWSVRQEVLQRVASSAATGSAGGHHEPELFRGVMIRVAC